MCKRKFKFKIYFSRDICFVFFLLFFLFFQEFGFQSAQEIKKRDTVILPSLNAAGPRSRFHPVTLKSGEVTTQHLSDCWHFQAHTPAPRPANCHSRPRRRWTRRPKCHGAFVSTEVRQRGTLSADAPTRTLRHLMLLAEATDCEIMGIKAFKSLGTLKVTCAVKSISRLDALPQSFFGLVFFFLICLLIFFIYIYINKVL